eukprot:75986-Pelagomonas_calceolata.AAC.1
MQILSRVRLRARTSNVENASWEGGISPMCVIDAHAGKSKMRPMFSSCVAGSPNQSAKLPGSTSNFIIAYIAGTSLRGLKSGQP